MFFFKHWTVLVAQHLDKTFHYIFQSLPQALSRDSETLGNFFLAFSPRKIILKRINYAGVVLLSKWSMLVLDTLRAATNHTSFVFGFCGERCNEICIYTIYIFSSSRYLWNRGGCCSHGFCR